MVSDSTKRRAGRPPGQFAYHKSVLLQFLQEYGKPYCGNNEQIVADLKEKYPKVFCTRQIGRYLNKLVSEQRVEVKVEWPSLRDQQERRVSSYVRTIKVLDEVRLHLY